MSLASRILTAALGLWLLAYFWPFGAEDPEQVIATEPPGPAIKPLYPRPALPGEKAAQEKDAGATKPPPKPKLFYRVIVRDGDTIEAGDVVITLSGIKAHDADEKCKDGTGRTWPCGTRARTALMRLIHGRAVSCVTPSSGKQKSFTARCTVGRTDLSVWMVTQGWATLAAPKDSKLADAAEAAQKKKLGIWR